MMKTLGIFLVVCVTLLGQVSVARAEDDFQSWNDIEISKRLGTEWELFCIPQIRIRDDASDLFRHEYRQGIRWKHFQHLQFSFHYLFARDSSSGKPLEEHSGELDVTPKAKVGLLDLSLRGRVAMRTLERSAGEQEWQFRFMPKIAYPTKIAGRKVTPYAADDLFYEDSRDAWNQNRLFLGVSLPLGKKEGVEFSIEPYYMLQHQRGTRKDWNSNHILGTKLGLRF